MALLLPASVLADVQAAYDCFMEIGGSVFHSSSYTVIGKYSDGMAHLRAVLGKQQAQQGQDVPALKLLKERRIGRGGNFYGLETLMKCLKVCLVLKKDVPWLASQVHPPSRSSATQGDCRSSV